MTDRPLACVILAAGQGVRMKSSLPKVMHALAGRPMIRYVIEAAEALEPERIVVVTGPGMEDVAAACLPYPSVVQAERLGTGDAVKAARGALEGFEGDVLILYGDVPLIAPGDLKALIHQRRHPPEAALSLMVMHVEGPNAYGRVFLDEHGHLDRIVELKDATPDQAAGKLCNAGLMCVDGSRLFGWLDRLDNRNAQGEYYLTDLPALARKDGLAARVLRVAEDNVLGVNSRADLAMVEAILQDRLRRQALAGGATLIDPDTVYFAHDTALGRDVVIEPNVFFGPGVSVGDGAVIHAFSHLERCAVREGASIGPFARLRPGADIGAGGKIGNFVEIKNAVLGEGVKASHLAYIGDAEVGAHTNFSCGAITVNYDGFSKKSKTVIGENAMIGSNVNLVAPVTIGAGACVAAGTTVAKDVPPDALAVAREKPTIVEGWAAARRKKKPG